jgi:hypothetical protein
VSTVEEIISAIERLNASERGPPRRMQGRVARRIFREFNHQPISRWMYRIMGRNSGRHIMSFKYPCVNHPPM